MVVRVRGNNGDAHLGELPGPGGQKISRAANAGYGRKRPQLALVTTLAPLAGTLRERKDHITRTSSGKH